MKLLCQRCQRTRLVRFFYPRPDTRRGFRSNCNDCESEMSRLANERRALERERTGRKIRKRVREERIAPKPPEPPQKRPEYGVLVPKPLSQLSPAQLEMLKRLDDD